MLISIITIGIAALFYRMYAEMAFSYDKPRVGIGCLGAGIFVGTYIITVVVFALIVLSSGMKFNDQFIATLALEGTGMGIGALAAWLVYSFLKKSWSAKKAAVESELLDNKL
jgi:uncharacterized membrane protein required for colicin V production